MIKKSSIFKKFKKIFGISALGAIILGSAAGITVASLDIATNTNLSADFDPGINYKIQLNLVDKDNKPLYKKDEITGENKIIDIDATNKLLSDTSNIFSKQLQTLGLTNISLSSGYGSYSYNKPDSSLTTIPIGIISAKFENSLSALNTTAIDKKNPSEFTGEFTNHDSIEKKIIKANRLELENIQNKYDGYNGSHSINASTGRDLASAILFDKKIDDIIKGSNNFEINAPGNLSEEIKLFTNSADVESTNSLQLVQAENYNTKPFIKEKWNYDKLSPDSSNPTFYVDDGTGDGGTGDGGTGDGGEPTTPNPQDSYQTGNTWFLWNDKQGFINYLNRIVYAVYFNRYANDIKTSTTDVVIGTPSVNPDIFSNYVDKYLRNNINAWLDSLSEIEKNIAKFLTISTNGKPEVINENNLFGFLYEFWGSDQNTSKTEYKDANLASKSELDGWGFLETNNNDFSDLFGNFLIGKIDYSNFSTFLEDPTPPRDPDLEPLPPPENVEETLYITDKIQIFNSGSSIEEFTENIKNERYSFPVINTAFDSLQDGTSDLTKALATAKIINAVDQFDPTKPQINQWEDPKYIKAKKDLADIFSPSIIFGLMSESKQRFDTPDYYNFPIFSILMIVISALIFMVGIFISIRYRIPGLLVFLSTSLTFTLSMVLFNAFGFTFSFFSFIGLLFGVLLSTIIPFFIFKNFKKELCEGSSVYGSYIKTLKKYWKVSLDTHIVSLLASFAFLFFGKLQIVDFGAMLVITSFLSAIISGVILFSVIYFLLYIFSFENTSIFINKKMFMQLKTTNEKFEGENANIENESKSKKKIIKSLNTFNFYSKKHIIVISIFSLIAVAGIILLGILGPSFSLDFSGTKNLIFSNANILFPGVIDYSSLPGYISTSIPGYVFDNQLFIQTNASASTILEWIKGTFTGEQQLIALNSYSIVETSSKIALESVYSLLKCMGIAIGFISIWILISLNWIAILPIIVTQLVSLLLIIGFVGITRMPLNIEGITAFILIFMISTIYSAAIISSIKTSWNRKELIALLELKYLSNSIISKINSNFIFLLFTLMGLSVIAIILTFSSLLFTFITIIIGCISIMFTLPYVLVPLWYRFIIIRDIYLKELVKSSQDKVQKRHITNYDDVDEQLIKGMNC